LPFGRRLKRAIDARIWGRHRHQCTYADYWRWSKDTNAPIWKNRIPTEIVRAFEHHGFIWGGYWYHFDTMHFEYRPELLPDEPMPH
jgi:hypothetical protein